MRKALVTVHLGRHFKKFGHYDYKVLLDMGYEVHIAANFNEEIDQFEDSNAIKHQINFNRNPFNITNFKAIKQLEKLFKEYNFDIILTQSPSGGAVTRMAANKTRKNGTIIIYTAHGFHFYKGAPIKNWLIYYPIEKWLSKYTDVLITINKEDFNNAKKSLKANIVEYVPGVGVDTSKFSNVIVNKSVKRKSIGVPEDAFVILSVGELNKNKNHEIVIRTVAKLNNLKIHYVICGQGPLENYLKNLINKLNLEKQVHLLGFRKDNEEIYKASDIFVFPSYREGLSVALMEAMASGLPVVCSKIRGNTDLIENTIGGYLVEPNDVNKFAVSIAKLINDPELCMKMGERNYIEVKKYDNIIVNEKMIQIFEKVRKDIDERAE